MHLQKFDTFGGAYFCDFCGGEHIFNKNAFFGVPAKPYGFVGKRRHRPKTVLFRCFQRNKPPWPDVDEVGSLISTWVTAPTSLPFWRMGEPLIPCTNATSAPWRAAAKAAQRPERPPPTTTTGGGLVFYVFSSFSSGVQSKTGTPFSSS